MRQFLSGGLPFFTFVYRDVFFTCGPGPGQSPSDLVYRTVYIGSYIVDYVVGADRNVIGGSVKACKTVLKNDVEKTSWHIWHFLTCFPMKK